MKAFITCYLLIHVSNLKKKTGNKVAIHRPRGKRNLSSLQSYELGRNRHAFFFCETKKHLKEKGLG